MLKSVDKETKVERELNDIMEEFGLGQTINATTNGDIELNIKDILLQDAKKWIIPIDTSYLPM